MKNTSIAAAINKSAVNSDVVCLLAVELDIIDQETGDVEQTIRAVKNSEPVVINGNTYEAAAFDFNINEKENELPEVSLSMSDPYLVFNNYLERYQGLKGSKVRIATVNANETDMKPAFYRFSVKSASSDSESYVATINLGVPNQLTQKFPARRQTKLRCQWRYKSPECGYTGSMESCDLSMDGPNGCEAHGNVRNFGGYPSIQVRNL
mgnify:CR=1 FL=1